MAEKILVIDDDTLNLKMAERILKDTYDVFCAKSGMEGIDMIRNSKMDLVLLDLDMPYMNGLEVLAKIREDESIADVKVAILTAAEGGEEMEDAIRLGTLDFIKKPFLPVKLLERVKKILEVEK